MSGRSRQNRVQPGTHEQAATVDWFVRRGVPSLLRGTGLRPDTGAAMVRPLVVVYLLAFAWYSVGSASGWIFDLAVALFALGAVIVLSNLLRRRALFQLLDRVGWVEVVLFVAVPSLLYGLAQAGVVFGQLPDDFEAAEVLDVVVVSAVIMAAFMLVLLFLVWLLVRSGLVALVGWLTSELLGSIGSAGVALARTVPLLLGVVTFFTFTTEVWQTVGRVTTVPYTATILLFVVVSGLFLSSRWQLDIDALATFNTREELDAALHSFPGSAQPASFPATCELSRRQALNLRFIAALSKLVVASLVASLVFVFFLAFEFLAIDAPAVKSWVQTDPKMIFTWDVATHTFALTWEHVKVAGFLAVFTGFYFSIVSVTDAQLREGLRDTAEDAVRDACAARLAVTSAADAPSAAAPAAT